MSWGYYNGNLSIIDNVAFYPWEVRFVDQYSQSETYQYSKCDPYNVPELPGLLRMPLQERLKFKSDVGGNNVFHCFHGKAVRPLL